MFDGELRFRYAEVQRELKETEKLARHFLDRRAVGLLSQAADHLAYRRRQGGSGEWGLSQGAPLITRPSRGYEVGGRRGSHELQASIDSTWGITAEDPHTFRVTGNVSTRVRLLDGDGGRELGRWRIEFGAAGAPGCFFHTQIRAQAEDQVPPWPHSVPVPRLPSPFVSIPAVVTFVLGELFQTQWAQHVDSPRADRLAADQRRHWENRLQWELELVRRQRTLPWSAVKRALPHRDLFLRESPEDVFQGG